MRDTTKIEITRFKQDENREDGTGTLTVVVIEGDEHKRGEVPNTTVADFIEKANAKIGHRNVTNMIGQDRHLLNQARKAENSDIYQAMHTLNAKKRSRHFD